MRNFLKVSCVCLALSASVGFLGCSLFREECDTCGGTGYVVSFLGVKITCPDCNGKGYITK
jgi:DnaJ-class molecular chaperone